MKYSKKIAVTINKCLEKKIAMTLLAVMTSSVQAAVLDTDPGDYVPLPVGTELGLIYYQHTERDRVKADGNTLTKDFGLDSDIGIFRYVHWTEVAGFTITPQIILPMGHVKLSGLQTESTTGIADPIIGSALWLLNDKEKERYFSVSAYMGIPIGSYSENKAAINLGENRWKGIFHAAYVQAIVPKKLYGEMTLEQDVFGKNNDFAGNTLHQESVFEVQAHLRYVLDPKNTFGVSYYHEIGGKTKIDGVSQDDELKTDSLLFSWQRMIQPTWQLQTQIGKDLYVQNGPQENLRLNFRLAHLF